MTDTKDSAEFIKEADKANGVDANRLLSYLERIEHLEEEKKVLQNDIKEIFEERESQEYVVEQYRRALGI